MILRRPVLKCDTAGIQATIDLTQLELVCEQLLYDRCSSICLQPGNM